MSPESSPLTNAFDASPKTFPISQMESILDDNDEFLKNPITDLQRNDQVESSRSQPPRAVETAKLESKESTPENDSLSDETHFDHVQAGSNESSKHPSPNKQMNFKAAVRNVNVDQLIATPTFIHSYDPKPSVPRCDEAWEPPVPAKENQEDIAEFIDNFLENDEFLNGLPSLNACSKQEPLDFEVDDSSAKDVSQDLVIHDEHARNPQPPVSGPFPSHVNTRAGNYITRGATPSYLPRRPSMTAATVRRPEKRKPRTYSQAIPSQHCHICSRRPTEGSPHQICGNLQKGRCRKTICTKCFHQFRWDLKAAREAPPGTWECPHCRGECPQRAQCVIYNRTSDRRRLKLINHRKRKNAPQGTKHMTSVPAGKKQIVEKSTSPDSGRTVVRSVPALKPGCARASTSHSMQPLQTRPRAMTGSLKPGEISKEKPRLLMQSVKKEEVLTLEDSREQLCRTSRTAAACQTRAQSMSHERPLESPLPDPHMIFWNSDVSSPQAGGVIKTSVDDTHAQEETHLANRDMGNLGMYVSGQPSLPDENNVGFQLGGDGEPRPDDHVAKDSSPLGPFTVCIEDLLPGPDPQLEIQDEFLVADASEAVDDLWGLEVSEEGSGVVNKLNEPADIADAQGKGNILNRIDLESIAVSNNDRNDKNETHEGHLFNEF